MAKLATAPLYDDIAGLPQGGAAVWLTTADGLRLRLATWDSALTPTRGTVLIFTGRTEYIEKYGPVISRLRAMGLAVAIWDWRGQGLSTRPGGDPTYGWVKDFAQYQTDLAAVMSAPQVTALPGPHVMLAHSMGGAIGLRALHNGLDVAGAIFSAPMWGIKMPGIATYIAMIAKKLGFGRKRPPFVTSAVPYVLDSPFDGNVLTGDAEVYAWLAQTLRTHPDLSLGGPSFGWIAEGARETKSLSAFPAVTAPTLTFLGSRENVVLPAPIQAYHAKPGAGDLKICPEAEHEIFMETAAIQDPVWTQISKFLDMTLAKNA